MMESADRRAVLAGLAALGGSALLPFEGAAQMAETFGIVRSSFDVFGEFAARIFKLARGNVESPELAEFTGAVEDSGDSLAQIKFRLLA